MQEAVKIISENGIWVFLIGILTSILIGAIKTPIRAKYLDSVKDSAEKQKRENLFDTLVFLSTYVIAFLAAMVYYLISSKVFNIVEMLKLSLPIWLSQSLAYGVWKKLGIKRALGLLSKLIFKDTDHNGEVSFDEAISQIVKGIKEGKLEVSEVISTVNENLPEVVEEAVEVSKGDPEVEKAIDMVKGGIEGFTEEIKSEVIESAKKVADVVIGKANDGTEILDGTGSSLKF